MAEDKADESEDKEMVLGEDLVNPFTGLTLRDYLDGRESSHKELLARTGALNKPGGECCVPCDSVRFDLCTLQSTCG